jgi:hypothetical protein
MHRGKVTAHSILFPKRSTPRPGARSPHRRRRRNSFLHLGARPRASPIEASRDRWTTSRRGDLGQRVRAYRPKLLTRGDRELVRGRDRASPPFRARAYRSAPRAKSCRSSRCCRHCPSRSSKGPRERRDQGPISARRIDGEVTGRYGAFAGVEGRDAIAHASGGEATLQENGWRLGGADVADLHYVEEIVVERRGGGNHLDAITTRSRRVSPSQRRLSLVA